MPTKKTLSGVFNVFSLAEPPQKVNVSELVHLLDEYKNLTNRQGGVVVILLDLLSGEASMNGGEMITFITPDGFMVEIGARARLKELLRNKDSALSGLYYPGEGVSAMAYGPKHGGDDTACEQENCGTDHGDSSND